MRKFFKIISSIIIFIFLLLGVIVIFNNLPKAPNSYKATNTFRKTGGYPLIIPHGGAKQLAPENTVYSYDKLINDFGADVLEIDLALTKDNILIAHHDLDLEFSEDSLLNNKLIKDYTYQEIIDEYDNDNYFLARNFEYVDGTFPFKEAAKSELATMIPARIDEDVFKLYGDSVLYILEIKDSPTSQLYEKGSKRYAEAADLLIELVVEKYQLSANVILASFSDEVLAYFRQKAPDIIVNAGEGEATNFAIFSAFHIDFFWKVKGQVLILPNRTSMEPIGGTTAKILNILPKSIKNNIGIKVGKVYEPNLMHKQLVNDAHRKNMAVFYWTVNDVEEMKHLIEIGADGIITDRPDLLKLLIDELKGE